MTGITEIPLKQIKHEYLEAFSPTSADKTIVLSHFGNFTENKITSLIKLTEEIILETGAKRQTMRRVCSLMVEALQNIINHSAKDEHGDPNSFLILESEADKFRLKTGNLIWAKDIIPLEQKLNSINRLNENELRKQYIETLCNDNFNQKGGAGLGFLTMAKKITGNIDYSMISVNQKCSYFVLGIALEKDLD